MIKQNDESSVYQPYICGFQALRARFDFECDVVAFRNLIFQAGHMYENIILQVFGFDEPITFFSVEKLYFPFALLRVFVCK